MADACDQHFVIVATKPREFPGAYASCIDEAQWLSNWSVERLQEGATLQRVTCNHGHELMKQYVAWCDEEDRKAAVLKETTAWVKDHRAKLLAQPSPRKECPGCFSPIYDLAEKDGWCWDCNPANPRNRNPRTTKGTNG
jgi:hypothetical protein